MSRGATGYEVRLDAWSCSCPAFAFKVVNVATTSHVSDQGIDIQGRWSFGGLSLGTEVPICKHLLACALIEHCDSFQGASGGA